jgi:hypothetical protein
MPYINQCDREKYELFIQNILALLKSTDTKKFSGELNYLITRILIGCEASRYGEMNSLIGVLECVKQEYYRRKMSKYEDLKVEENGDVY